MSSLGQQQYQNNNYKENTINLPVSTVILTTEDIKEELKQFQLNINQKLAIMKGQARDAQKDINILNDNIKLLTEEKTTLENKLTTAEHNNQTSQQEAVRLKVKLKTLQDNLNKTQDESVHLHITLRQVEKNLENETKNNQ